MSRKVIGEGGYGCVHEPSIHCKTPPEQHFTYENYVSKIMKTKNAKSELAEFLIIKKIDPSNQYHLGSPILCQPDLTEHGIKDDLKKCKHIDEEAVLKDPDNYSLLLLKFGGYDLKVFFADKLTNYLKTNKQDKVDKLLLGFHHLIKGIHFFWTNQMIHNDIKPQNILFNPDTGQFKYIDFGLMGTYNDILTKSNNSNNGLGIFHWSYPFDCGFMNRLSFNEYRIYSQERKKKYRDFFIEYVIGSEKKNLLKIPMNRPGAFKILFSYINPELSIPDVAVQTSYINSFFDGFDKIAGPDSKYINYIVNAIRGIDVFGLGFTLQYAVNSLKKQSAITNDAFVRLSAFFNKMYDFNPLSRVIDTTVLLNEYENILLEIGVLTRINKTFENNVLVNKSPIIINLGSSRKSKHLSAELQAYANEDPIEITRQNKCANGFIKNRKTGDCVKKSEITRRNKCANGFIKNRKTGNCVKKSEITKRNKCANGFIKNRKTGDCVKKSEITKRNKCANGFIKNRKTGDCVKKSEITKRNKCANGFIKNSIYSKTKSKSKSKSKTYSSSISRKSRSSSKTRKA
jgi:serine/threonine protein kinase